MQISPHLKQTANPIKKYICPLNTERCMRKEIGEDNETYDLFLLLLSDVFWLLELIHKERSSEDEPRPLNRAICLGGNLSLRWIASVGR